MENNSEIIEYNLNKLFKKMYLEKYPSVFESGYFVVIYNDGKLEETSPYYEIDLFLILNLEHDIKRILKIKSENSIHSYFKKIVKYVQAYNFIFDIHIKYN